MKRRKVISFIDAVIVLLNIAAGRGNVLGNWLLFTENSFIFPAIVIVLDIIYLLANKKRIKQIFTRQFKSIMPWLIWIALIFYNFLNLFLHVGGLDLPSFEYGMVAFLVFLVLNKQAMNKRVKKMALNDRVFYLSRGYIWLSAISIFGVFISFLLYTAGLVGDATFSADFLVANEDAGNHYSRVFLSVRNYYTDYLSDFVRVPFFQDKGVFCGLFHEPHIITYNVFPCFILLLGYYTKFKQKFWIILSGVLIMLFAGSATNVLVVLACVSVYFLKVGRRNVLSMVLGASVVLIAVLVYISIDDTFLMFILDRLDGGNASNEYSRDLLRYAFSPKSLFGYNFLSTDFMKSGVQPGRDVGYVAFTLNIVFLFLYLKNTVRLIFRKESMAAAVGFASLYWILHSAKIGMTMYAQILPVLLVFLQIYVLVQLRSREKYAAKVLRKRELHAPAVSAVVNC